MNRHRFLKYIQILRNPTTSDGCKNFSRGYLHHLDKTREMLGSTLQTIHNLHFYLNLMTNLRLSIESGTLHQFAREFEQTWNKIE